MNVLCAYRLTRILGRLPRIPAYLQDDMYRDPAKPLSYLPHALPSLGESKVLHRHRFLHRDSHLFTAVCADRLLESSGSPLLVVASFEWEVLCNRASRFLNT